MKIKRYGIITAFIILLIGNAHSVERKVEGISLGRSSMTQITMPQSEDISYLLLDFEYPENEMPRGFRWDFNDDGIEDYFVESWHSLCGTGGCPYALIDGKSRKRIGTFFGAPIFVLLQKINGYPVIHSYQHGSSNSGQFTVYVFDGRKYQIVSSIELIDDSVSKLFKSYENLKPIKASK